MKSNLKNKIAVILTAAITVTSFGTMNAFAFSSGYRTATEYTDTVSEYIESPTQNDWYKIDVTEDMIPCTYYIALGIPTSCVYNFDFSRADLGTRNRPEIISCDTVVSSDRKRIMRGVLTETGTYYVRVYSQNGTTANLDAYELRIRTSNSGKTSYSFKANLPTSTTSDWSVCADIVGNFMYEKYIYGSTTSRNYQNANTFITSGYESDSTSLFNNTVKATPEQTAIAANYIYSGYKMVNPKFVVRSNKVYQIDELLRYVYEYNEPIIFYMAEDDTIPRAQKKYIVLKSVNIGANQIVYYDPWSGSTVQVDYTTFISEGIYEEYGYVPYTGISIVPNDNKATKQVIYN